MNTEFKKFIIEEISNMPFYHVSPNGISHTIKCPYCNDDSPRHGHFCLKIDVDSDEPILYNCLKCDHGGILNPTVLTDLNIRMPQNLVAQMRKSNKIYAKKNNLTNISIMPFEIPDACNILPIQLAQAKVDYINNRLSTNFTIADMPSLRIVLSLNDFIAKNNIVEIPDISKKYVNYIDANYVGFLSVNRNCIIFRKLDSLNHSKNALRYIKVVIDRKNLDENSFFTVPTSFDIMNPYDVNVHISEGPFDILGVLVNGINAADERNMYFAICGFGYTGVIRNVIKMGICPNINLNIYADNDKSDNEILRQITPKRFGIINYIKSITIIRNNFPGEKDFGVPKDRIKPSYKRIKL